MRGVCFAFGLSLIAAVGCDKPKSTTPPPAGDGGEVAACSEADCGPAPGMPAKTCADGSVGGNTGVCQRNDDGTCGWEIRECPGGEGDDGSDTCAKPADTFTACERSEVFGLGCCYPNFEAACTALGCAGERCVMMKSSPPQASCTPPKPS